MTQAVHPQQFHRPPHANQVRIASGLNFLAGVYLLIAGWLGGVNGGNQINSIVFGIIVAVLGAIRFMGSTRVLASWINVFLGGWIIVSPWVFGYAGTRWMWNSIVVGIIVAVLGVWSATASATNRKDSSTSP